MVLADVDAGDGGAADPSDASAAMVAKIDVLWVKW